MKISFGILSGFCMVLFPAAFLSGFGHAFIGIGQGNLGFGCRVELRVATTHWNLGFAQVLLGKDAP